MLRAVLVPFKRRGLSGSDVMLDRGPQWACASRCCVKSFASCRQHCPVVLSSGPVTLPPAHRIASLPTPLSSPALLSHPLICCYSPLPALFSPAPQVVFTPGLTPDDRTALLKGAHDKAGEHVSRLLKFVVARAGEGSCLVWDG